MRKIKNLLLVDDDYVSNILTEHTLQDMNLAEQILVATNGQEALAHLSKYCRNHSGDNCPNLVLLDINMPVMNGFEFLTAFKQQNWPQPPLIVMYTSSDNPRDLDKARQFGVAGYVSKPLTPEKLLPILDPWLGSNAVTE